MSVLEEVRRKSERIHAYNECVKVTSLHQWYINQNLMTEELELWSKRDDTCFQAVWGCYEGFEGIKRCFMQDFGDRRDPRNNEMLKGYMNAQSMNSELLFIAEDGQTARGRWYCSGAITIGKEALDPKDSGQAYWDMATYGIDYIKEDGKWKIWHMLMAPVYYAPYETKWGECAPYERYPIRKTTEDRPPLRPIFNYTTTCEFDLEYPAWPGPYKTFADVAPGYGYNFSEGMKNDA